MSDIASIPWYFGEIRVDPVDPETVYHLGVPLMVSRDGGRTWERTGRGPHSDNHALWINPENRDHLILGNDGGLYVSRDRAETWDFSPNLPVSQFYAVSLDNAEPFFGIAGGLQDNSTWGGPSRTRSNDGIYNSDWYGMAGGDGFYAAIDPTDPDIAYVESQEGNILRYDRRTGDRKPIQPQPGEGEPPYRFNWSSPIKISPWDHNTVYFAANHLFRSTDQGNGWTRLGGDLTRNIEDDSLPMMGAVPKRDAVARHEGVVDFSTISDVDVSTVQRGMLVTGSDDGVVAVSTDDGATWNKQMHFPGVPDTAYVSKVRFSRHDANTIYVTFDNHRSNDFHPYVIRSTDAGKTWTNITHNLPELGNVRAFAEHFRNPDLLFVGTERGIWTSLDRGATWVRMQGGLPTVRVDDLAIQERENTLVAATHGRGFWLVDDLGSLEHLAEAKTAEGAYLVPVKADLQFTPDPSPTSGTHGARDFQGANPGVGTTVSYMLKSGTRDVKLEIVDASGGVVRTLAAPAAPGLHHVKWDFRRDVPYSGPAQERPQQGGFGGGFFGFGNAGVPVPPGEYTARLSVGGDALERRFTVKKDPALRLTDAQVAELYQVRMRQAELNAQLTMAIRQSDEVAEQLKQATAAMAGANVSAALEEPGRGDPARAGRRAEDARCGWRRLLRRRQSERSAVAASAPRLRRGRAACQRDAHAAGARGPGEGAGSAAGAGGPAERAGHGAGARVLQDAGRGRSALDPGAADPLRGLRRSRGVGETRTGRPPVAASPSHVQGDVSRGAQLGVTTEIWLTKRISSNVRFSVLLVKPRMTMPPVHVMASPSFTCVSGPASQTSLPSTEIRT